MKILGEDTQADLQSSEIQAQETHPSQKAFKYVCILKKGNLFITPVYRQKDRVLVPAEHPACSAVTALLSAQIGQETRKAEKYLEMGQLLRKQENMVSSRRLLNSSFTCLHEGETAACCLCCRRIKISYKDYVEMIPFFQAPSSEFPSFSQEPRSPGLQS